MTKAKNLINELYIKEDEKDMLDDAKSKFTVQLDITSIAMLNCISRRFSTSRFSLIEPVLRCAVSDMFRQLTSLDRELLAKEADAEALAILKKEGKPIVGEPFVNTWVQAAEYLSKEDSK